MTNTKVRESNFELLRIIAMFMVLVLHADFIALGAPGKEDLISSPIISIFKVFLEELSIVAVNVFVLISGWFRIKPSLKGFCKFAFQCLFFSFGIYLFMILSGNVEFSFKGIAECFALMPVNSYWFIPSYICLYLMSTVLNTFIDNVDKRTYAYVLLAFFSFQTLYAFIGGGAEFFMRGYSAPSFVGLYLLAAFVRKHIDCTKYDRRIYLLGYLGLSLFLTVLYIISIYLDLSPVYSRINAYSNPLIILSSLLLLLFFSTLNFQNRIINFLSVSSFAVYLLHCNPNIFYIYLLSIDNVIINHTGIEYLLVWVIIGLWFFAAIIIDQLRIIIWRGFLNCLNFYDPK